MSIMIDESTRVIIQGATGRVGSYHTRLMQQYGTKVVAGVTPGRGGAELEGVPVFNTMAEAMRERPGDLVIQFVSALRAKEAVFDAIDAGVRTVVCTAEGVPVHDTIRMMDRVRQAGAMLVGPNTMGLMSPGRAKAGFFAAEICQAGPVGIASKSGSLAHAAVIELRRAGIGQSTIVGIGGDPISGVNFVDCIKMFNEDPDTKAILLLGAIGGENEEDAAAFVTANPGKPIVVLVVGKTAPAGVAMGHAGAIVMGERGSREGKCRAFMAAGIPIAETLAEVPKLLARALER
jgi:succinyl-CoA synthetase alpha subunit